MRYSTRGSSKRLIIIWATFFVYGGIGREMASEILHYRGWSFRTHYI
jgi:hypothetical protein